MKLTKPAACAFFLVALVACGGPRERASTGRGASAIQGGAEDDVHTFAVAVIMPDSTCSGTLIAPNLVLTARHCVADSGSSDAVDCSRDKFSPPAPAARFAITTEKVVRSGSAKYRVAKVLVPTESKFCGNDIALLLLDENVPASEATPAAPALDPPMSTHPLYGTTVATLGYGISGPRKNDDGTRRLREDVPIQCTPGDPTKSCRLSDFDITDAEFVAGDGLCSGDSGGSAFDQESFTRGRPVTFGVLSRAGETGLKCVDAVFTRTDAFSDLLVGAAKEAA
ncbi:MAG TPA: trypsin-like serine protease, partial [Polyangiaceae bacterium]|nr:trypsin-like serine protease [Polyangiaceae bacterium]